MATRLEQAQPVDRQRLRHIAIVTTVAFFGLGLPDGMLGVVWPRMRITYGRSVGALGVLTAASTIAFFVASSLSGSLQRRQLARRLLLAGSIGAAAGSVVTGLAPWFWTVVVGVGLLGLFGGTLDPVLSILVSVTGRQRLMNAAHGAYGAGAAIGPLIVAAWATAASWRAAYLTLAVVQATLIVAWSRTPVPQTALHGDAPPRGTPRERTALLSPALLGLLVFFFTSGLEIAAGAWAATVLTGRFGESAGRASIEVFAYWASLSLSRFALSVLPQRLSPRLLVLLGCWVAAAGSALLWAADSAALAVVALLVLGIGSGPVFPALTILTPQRVGAAAAGHVIGWQLGAASLGAAAVSGGIGVSVGHLGLRSVGMILTIVAVVVLALAIALDRVKPHT